MLAFGTVAIAARMIAILNFTASGASVDLATQRFRAQRSISRRARDEKAVIGRNIFGGRRCRTGERYRPALKP